MSEIEKTNRNLKKEIKRDIKFLVEMEGYIDEMVGNFNLVDIQHIQTMVKDWLFDLRGQLKIANKEKGGDR